MFALTYRRILLLAAATGIGATVFSLILQYGFGFDPCVMCIIQRVSLLAAGLLALAAACLPQRSAAVRLFSATAVSLPALWGAWTAAKQIHLQSLPPETQPSCGAPWTFRLQDAPLFDLYEPLIRGFGQCGVSETFLGVPFPWWMLLTCACLLLLLWGGLHYCRRKP